MVESCRDCRFFKPDALVRDRGNCRVNPPIFVPARFPECRESDWCGCFQPVERPQATVVRDMTVAPWEDARIETAKRRLSGLMAELEAMDPTEICADGGVTVFDVWRKEVVGVWREISGKQR